jgi:hypothetical protein
VLLKPALVARHEAVADIMRAIARECVAAGRAEGAKLDDAIIEQVIMSYRSAPPDSLTRSMPIAPRVVRWKRMLATASSCASVASTESEPAQPDDRCTARDGDSGVILVAP